MNYGLPYKGSKNRLAENILALFPKRKNLYDLFSGGGAITHCALLKNQFDHVVMNDINPAMTTLFIDAAQGKYKNESRWISRKQFEEEKLTDPYIACVWSFGNNLRDYLYGYDREEIKHSIHNAIFFDDYESIKKYWDIDISIIKNDKDYHQKYLHLKQILSDAQLENFERLEKLQGLENLQSLQSLQSLERLERLERLEILSTSFDNVNIEPDSIIYCDIPYENTNCYSDSADNFGFNFDMFYDWAERQTEPVFISSYKMPEDRFECIARYEHRSTLCATANNAVIEKVFIPKTQTKLYKAEMPQPSLFEDFM